MVLASDQLAEVCRCWCAWSTRSPSAPLDRALGERGGVGDSLSMPSRDACNSGRVRRPSCANLSSCRMPLRQVRHCLFHWRASRTRMVAAPLHHMNLRGWFGASGPSRRYLPPGQAASFSPGVTGADHVSADRQQSVRRGKTPSSSTWQAICTGRCVICLAVMMSSEEVAQQEALGKFDYHRVCLPALPRAA
jgi:hypothetical protein